MAKTIKKDQLIKIGALALTLLLFGAAVFAIVKMINAKQTSGTEPSYTNPTGAQRQTLTYNGKEYILKEDVEAILLLGVDDYQNEENNISKYLSDSQADVIYVFVIDHKNKTYQTLQLNRDTITNVATLSDSGKDAGTAPMQLALAHSYGKDDQARCANTVDAVSGLIYDMDIDHYLSLTMDAIPVLNDQVGGVTVTIPKDMTAADPSFTQGATVTLHGRQAELFVRSRMSLPDDTNTFRMERQQIYLASWKEQATKKLESDSGFGLNLVLQLSNYLVSDMSANELSEFASQLNEYTDLGTVQTVGTYQDGALFKEYIVDQDDLEGKIVSIFYDEVTN